MSCTYNGNHLGEDSLNTVTRYTQNISLHELIARIYRFSRLSLYFFLAVSLSFSFLSFPFLSFISFIFFSPFISSFISFPFLFFPFFPFFSFCCCLFVCFLIIANRRHTFCYNNKMRHSTLSFLVYSLLLKVHVLQNGC